MKFPTLMYRVPGPFRRPGGLTFNTIGASDAEDFARFLGAGWYPSLNSALGLESHDMPVEEKPKRGRKRARTDVGQFQADDPATPDVNEAWKE
jgi:hypothetical protein